MQKIVLDSKNRGRLAGTFTRFAESFDGTGTSFRKPLACLKYLSARLERYIQITVSSTTPLRVDVDVGRRFLPRENLD